MEFLILRRGAHWAKSGKIRLGDDPSWTMEFLVLRRGALGWRWKRSVLEMIRLGPGYIFLFSGEALTGLEAESPNAFGREACDEAVAQVARAVDVDVGHRVVVGPRKDREEVDVLRGTLHGVVGTSRNSDLGGLLDRSRGAGLAFRPKPRSRPRFSKYESLAQALAAPLSQWLER